MPSQNRMKKLKDHFDTKWLILAGTLTAIVMVLTHIPQELAPSQLQAGGLDKCLHAVAYGAITFLLVLSIKSSISPVSALLVLFVLLGIGSLDEITQPLVRRQASFGDLLANAIGIATILSLFIACKRQIQKLRSEPASPLCFAGAVGFVAGVLVLPLTVIPIGILKRPSLQEKQAEAYSFFYRTMNDVFEGRYDLKEDSVSREALEMLKERAPGLGGKCWLFIYDDWYSQQRQMKGYFFGPAFFPSGDMFEVEMERVDKHFMLKKFRPGKWESAWQEMMKNSDLPQLSNGG